MAQVVAGVALRAGAALFAARGLGISLHADARIVAAAGAVRWTTGRASSGRLRGGVCDERRVRARRHVEKSPTTAGVDRAARRRCEGRSNLMAKRAPESGHAGR
jgi:hypothetical protein